MASRGQSLLACEELSEPVENVWNAKFPAVLNDFRALNVEIFLLCSSEITQNHSWEGGLHRGVRCSTWNIPLRESGCFEGL